MQADQFFRKRCIGALIVFVAICTASCEKALDLKDPPQNASAVFQDLWKTMDKNYALFIIKNINWDSVYSQNVGKFNDGLHDSRLFTELSNVIETLKDGHVTLISPTNTFTYENFYKSYSRNFNFENIKNNYLKNDYKQIGPIIYKVSGNIGYLYYSSFAQNVSEKELEDIFTDLAATKGLIVDIRNNSGGNLSNAEKLYSRFINAKKLVRYELKKKGPAHNDFYGKEAAYIEPAKSFYDKPVVVLTNRTCFSACNDFAMYMSYLPNVTIVGDQTGGGGSIPADYLLSNGWKLQYSSTITLSPDVLPIEDGIQPDINIGISSIDETIGKDPILEKAISLLL